MTSPTPALPAEASSSLADAPPPPSRKPRTPTTMQTLKRLKDMVQARINALEEEIKALGVDIDAARSERGIRATNTLVRTLEKVLELEHKDRKARKLKRSSAARLDDAGRQELASRIAKLTPDADSPAVERDFDASAGAGPDEGLASVGEMGSTAAPA